MIEYEKLIVSLIEYEEINGKFLKCPICGELAVVRVKCINGKTLFCLKCKTTPLQWTDKWEV